MSHIIQVARKLKLCIFAGNSKERAIYYSVEGKKDFNDDTIWDL